MSSPDLLTLERFHEGSLLQTIRSRFATKRIFTNVGSSILISVNPYRHMEGLFTNDQAYIYRKHS